MLNLLYGTESNRKEVNWDKPGLFGKLALWIRPLVNLCSGCYDVLKMSSGHEMDMVPLSKCTIPTAASCSYDEQRHSTKHKSLFFFLTRTSCKYIMWPSSLYNLSCLSIELFLNSDHIYQQHHLRPGLQRPIWRQIWHKFRAIHHEQHMVWSTTSLSKHIVKASLLLQF